MELTIKTLQGSFVLHCSETQIVADIAKLLWQQHPEQCPEPKQQRLVYKQQVLQPDAELQRLGITDGEQLVMLQALQDRRPPKLQAAPAPDAAAIRAAITEEARRRGLEHTLREERPPAAAARRSLGLPTELLNAADDQLLQLLQQALDGRLTVGGLRLGSSGDGTAHSGDAEDEEEEDGQVQPPEPAAGHISQITDMGFSAELARKALLLTRDNVQLALEWLFEHGDDADAAAPPTQEQLQQIYGRRRQRRGAAAAPAGGSSVAAIAAAALGQAGPQTPESVLSQLTEMGFDAASAQWALERVGPYLDSAISVLLGGGPAFRGSVGGAGRQREAAAAAAGEQDAGSDGDTPGLEETDEDEDEYEDADDDEEEDEEEEDEDEDGSEVDDDDDDDRAIERELAEAELPLPLQLEAALGAIDLEGLGSEDMEQLLQGAELQQLYGNQLLLAAGGADGPQASNLLRLQQLMAAAGQSEGLGSSSGDEDEAFADAEEGAG